jgi:predicted DNA-binding protein (MmcQ/YjbR family)
MFNGLQSIGIFLVIARYVAEKSYLCAMLHYSHLNTIKMNIEQIRDYTLSLYGVTEDQPFGDDIITFRLEGKIFLCLWLGNSEQNIKDTEPRLALKLSPERNEELRGQFSSVTPAWHWNKKHWSDVYYEQIEDALVQEWIRESYQLVASKLPKTIRQKYM